MKEALMINITLHLILKLMGLIPLIGHGSKKIMDSGASLADVRNKNLAVEKKELELIGTSIDLFFVDADAYLGLIKES
jgi:hypothetical protein